MVEFIGCAVGDKDVGHAEPEDSITVPMVREILHYGAAEPTPEHAIFGGEDMVKMCGDIVQRVGVERFSRPHIVVSDVLSVDGLLHGVTDSSDRQHGRRSTGREEACRGLTLER